MIAKNNEILSSATKSLYQFNADTLVREQCQAREDFEKHERTQQKKLHDLREIVHKQAETINQQAETINQQNSQIQDLDNEIAFLKAELNKISNH